MLDPETNMWSVQLPAQLLVPGQTFTATFSFIANRKAYTATQQITAGTVKVFVDQDNDTRVDAKDEQIKDANIIKGSAGAQKFAFWQKDTGKPMSPTDVLQDYATLRLYAGAAVPANMPGRIRLTMPGFIWQLAQKTTQASELEYQNDPTVTGSQKVQKKYLLDETEAQNQLAALGATAQCGYSQTSIVGLCPSVLGSDGTSGAIELPNLAPSNTGYEFLFDCTYCTQNDFQQINV